MTPYFTYEEASLLVRLLIAHCLTDFFLQPDKWVTEKRKKIWDSRYLWYHGLLTGLVAWIFLADFTFWWAILFITTSHILIDVEKLKWEKKTGPKFSLFMLDQLLHVSVIVISWLWMVQGWQRLGLFLNELPHYRIMLYVLGYLLMSGPVGFIIQFLTRKWQAELNPEDSLKDAGKWIGILERILALTFIYINQFGAIGLIITAKSILRVIDKPDRPSGEPTLTKPFSSRKRTEYVLIGTFLSFTITLITGLVINWLLSL